MKVINLLIEGFITFLKAVKVVIIIMILIGLFAFSIFSVICCSLRDKYHIKYNPEKYRKNKLQKGWSTNKKER